MIALLVALVVNVYGLMRFRPWAPKVSIWTSVVCYLLLPFMDVAVQSGITSAAISLGSMLWGIVVVLPYASSVVRNHFWPGSHSDSMDKKLAGYELSNG